MLIVLLNCLLLIVLLYIGNFHLITDFDEDSEITRLS